MSDHKVNISGEDLVALAERSKRFGTEDVFISIALDWIKAADSEIQKLRGELKKYTDPLAVDE